jgi:hypothetical protein
MSRVFAYLRRMACHEQAKARRMDRYVTDEQRSRPFFNATLRVARLAVLYQFWYAGRSPLEKQPTDLWQDASYTAFSQFFRANCLFLRIVIGPAQERALWSVL